jgi:hypothetical protein
MINWKIDTDGNLEVSGGSLVRIVSDDAIVQNLRATIYHSLKEWFLDVTTGINYKDRVLTRVYDPIVASREIRRAIKDAEGIKSIESFSMTREEKVITITFEVVTINATPPIGFNEAFEI